MTTKDDDDPFTPKDRARWFISHSHLYLYSEYTEMEDIPKLAANEEEHDDKAD